MIGWVNFCVRAKVTETSTEGKIPREALGMLLGPSIRVPRGRRGRESAVGAVAQFMQERIFAEARGSLVTIITDGVSVGGRRVFPFIAGICDGNQRILRAVALLEVPRATAVAIVSELAGLIQRFQEAGAAVVAYVTVLRCEHGGSWAPAARACCPNGGLPPRGDAEL